MSYEWRLLVWMLFNAIMVNVIKCLLWSDGIGTSFNTWQWFTLYKKNVYCFHWVSVISFSLAQRDHIKWHNLLMIQKKAIKTERKKTKWKNGRKTERLTNMIARNFKSPNWSTWQVHWIFSCTSCLQQESFEKVRIWSRKECYLDLSRT